MARTIDEVEARLAVASPWFDPNPVKVEAAVALVLREVEDDLEALFIRRAEHEDDPWSGDLAFPGGRIDPGDADGRAAAVRETLEELSLDLSSGRPIGRISDVLGFAESIRVSAYVYAIQGDPPLVPNYEIREAFWSPLSHSDDPARQEMRDFTYMDQTAAMPTIRLLDDPRAPVLWGITYKFMDDFMGAIGRPIPFMPWEEGDQGASMGDR
ncbi:MAG: CoA pyrophosphatase [bacterium]|nr:CoA pyrophosphatase [bacterium]